MHKTKLYLAVALTLSSCIATPASAKDLACQKYENVKVALTNEPCMLILSVFQNTLIPDERDLKRAYSTEGEYKYEACYQVTEGAIQIFPEMEPEYIRNYNPATFGKCDI